MRSAQPAGFFNAGSKGIVTRAVDPMAWKNETGG
jgi:hypothetical protein